MLAIHTMLPSWSCYYKIPRNSLCCSENPLSLLPCSSWHMNLPTDNFSHLPSIHSSPVDSCMSSIFEIPFDLPKILRSLLLLKFLLAYILVNPISLVILLASFVIIILSPLIQYVANACNPQSDPMIHHSRADVILNMNWFSTNRIAVGCTPKSTQLIHP